MPPPLFEPLALRDLALPNRIVVAPMCQYSADDDGSANDWHLVHYGSLSVGGFGHMMFEATAVEARGRITHACLGLYSDANERALARAVRFCKASGNTSISLQLAHAGAKASHRIKWAGGQPLGADERPWAAIAPSAVVTAPDTPDPEALDHDGIRAVVESFVVTTRRADRLGFDMLELHGAHGYLMHEFLSPLTNLRDDSYGGSRENRMRFSLEVFAAVRAAWPADKPLGIRISASDHADGGWTLEDSTVYAHELKALGCDFIDVSSGGLTPAQKITLGPGYQVPQSSHIRNTVGIPTMAVGMIVTPELANRVVAEGHADMVELARGILLDPRWAWHAADALGGQAAYPNQHARCRPDLWPEAFPERDFGEPVRDA